MPTRTLALVRRLILVLVLTAAAALADGTYVRTATLAASDKAHDVLKAPSHVAVEISTGIIVVADTLHHRIVTVAPDGTIAVLAGSGSPGLANGAGTAAMFSRPRGVAVDDARRLIYVADTDNNVIRAVTYDGVVTTLAGSGRPDDAVGSGALASFKQPFGVATDSAGNLYGQQQDQTRDTGRRRQSPRRCRP
jgi:DNA-binding beta-propeller fold protein YncE